MIDTYRSIVECYDHFSKAIHYVISTVKDLANRYGHMRASNKRFCKNGKHMRRKNYWKAVAMDEKIASQHKHFL